MESLWGGTIIVIIAASILAPRAAGGDWGDVYSVLVHERPRLPASYDALNSKGMHFI